MAWLKEKINLKFYFVLTLITIVVIEAVFARSLAEVIVFATISLASTLNQIMLIVGLSVVFEFKDSKPPLRELLKAGGLMLGKTLILGAAFYIGILFVKDRIIIALFIYLVQLANLFLSIRKN